MNYRGCPSLSRFLRQGGDFDFLSDHASHLLPSPRRPLRLNFHHSSSARNVMPKTAPRPILRTPHQATLHRIAMNVTQLLDSPGVASHIEVRRPKPTKVFIVFRNWESQSSRPFGFAQGRLCRRKRDKDGAPSEVRMAERVVRPVYPVISLLLESEQI